MDIRQTYRTSAFNHDFGFREYITPAYECDPKKQIIQRQYADYKHKRRQGKFKVTTRPKVCYFDELVKTNSEFPAPSRYKVAGDMIRRTKSASIKKQKVDLKVKKHTYIDNIEEYETKHKPPAIGKFDLTKYTGFEKKKQFFDKNQQAKIKNNNFDDVIKVAAELPGPGQFNPHLSVQKIRPCRTDMKYWKQKHESQHKKSSKSLSTKLGPSTYDPVVAGTFSHIQQDKTKHISRWSHGPIQIRKGLRSQFREPSPSQYNTVHQWISLSGKQKNFGNVNLLNRVTSARSFGVYH